MMEASKRFKVGKITIPDVDIIVDGKSDKIQDYETLKFDYKQVYINGTVDNWKTTFEYIIEYLISYCGGYLRTRTEKDGVYLDYLLDYGHEASQDIEFGVNMLELNEEISSEDLFTVLIPLGDENLTIEKVNNGSAELADAKSVAQFGRILRTHVFSSVTNPSTLLENAQRYLSSHINVPKTLTVNALDLHLFNPNIQEIYVGDSVQVTSVPHNVFEKVTCTAIEYDLENPSNNTYTFGTVKQTLTERYRQDIKKSKSGGGGAGAVEDTRAGDKSKVDWDPKIPSVDIWTKVKLIDDMFESLSTSQILVTSGDKISAINIKSLYEETDKKTNSAIQSVAHMHTEVTDLYSAVNLNADYIKKVDGVTTTHHATFLVYANETTSKIEGKADMVELKALDTNLESLKKNLTEVGIYLNGEKNTITLQALENTTNRLGETVIKNEARIAAVSDDSKTGLDLLTKRTIKGEEVTAKIELAVEANGKSIAKIEANEVTINSKITNINSNITNINSEITNVKKLIADSISAAFANIISLKVGILTAGVSVSTTSLDASSSIWTKSLVVDTSLTVNGTARLNGDGLATQKWVTDQKFLKTAPTVITGTFSATNVSATSAMYINGMTVATRDWCTTTQKYATQEWVNNLIASHKHTFSATSSQLAWGHTHQTTTSFQPGNLTLGVYQFDSRPKTVTVSGTTGGGK